MNSSMQVWIERRGGAGVLAPRRVSVAPPGPLQVRVAIEAAGVAYADIVMRQGLYPGCKPPIVPGYDLVGHVEQLGAQVTEFAIGERVAGVTVSGSYATHRNVDAGWLVKAPTGIRAESLVAGVLNGVTAWQMLHRIARASEGDWVLIHGAAGGVGRLLVQLARTAHINVIGTASRAKLERVARHGAVALDRANRNLTREVFDRSQGGVAAAFDHVGGRHFVNQSMATLRATGVGILYGAYEVTRGGTLHPLAMLDALLNTRLSAFRLFERSQGMVGYSCPIWRDARTTIYREDLSQVLGLIATGALEADIGAVFPLEQAADAHRALESRSVHGKVVLKTH